MDSGYAEPGGRAPAPAPLRLAQVFVNTADREGGTDALSTPPALVQWLVRYNLMADTESASEEDLALALDLREGLRSLFLSHHDGLPADAGADRLERALSQLPVRLTVPGGVVGAVPWSASPVRAALTEIAAVLIRADPALLTRLKACRRDVCQWVFYDSSRNRGSTWCAMDICGARSKMAAYRGRRREDDGGAGS